MFRVVQHHIGLERLVLQLGVGAAAQLLLDTQCNAGQQAVYQQPLIGAVRRRRELVALVQAKPKRPWHTAVGCSTRQRLRCLQARQQGPWVACGFVAGLDQLFRSAQAVFDLRHITPVVEVTRRPYKQRGANDKRKQRVATQSECAALAFPFEIGTRQAAFGKHHFAQQACEEVAATLARYGCSGLAAQSEAARQTAEHAVNRRAFLRAADKVHTAQQRMLLELRGREHLL